MYVGGSRGATAMIERKRGRGSSMARELAIPCFLARVAAGVALLAIGSVAAESLAVAAEAGTATEATGGTATEATGGTGATDSGALQEIIVTARKRAEDLQRTPVSITAFSQQDLENHS